MNRGIKEETEEVKVTEVLLEIQREMAFGAYDDVSYGVDTPFGIIEVYPSANWNLGSGILTIPAPMPVPAF